MSRLALFFLFTLPDLLLGCKATELRRTGFLSDYDRLEKIDEDPFFYRNPSFRKGA